MVADPGARTPLAAPCPSLEGDGLTSVDDNIRKKGYTAEFPADRFEARDLKRIAAIKGELQKHLGPEHSIGMSLVDAGVAWPCGCRWMVITSRCDPCKKVLGTGLIDPHTAVQVAQLMDEMERVAKMKAEIASRAPPEVERE